MEHTDQKRVALVIGGTRGIGAACADRLTADGCTVVVVGRSEPTTQHVFYQADAADEVRMLAVVEDVEKKYGPIEVLVCSAGVAETRLGIGVTVEDLESMSRSNLHTAVVPMRIVARLMARRSSGRIVAVSSAGAGFGLQKHLAYNASKAAVIGAARTFARELATRGITVNVVVPGPIDTEMLRQGERVEEYIASYVPMQRSGTPAEVAAAVSFLAAQDAGFVTGAIVPVDGGMTMCW